MNELEKDLLRRISEGDAQAFTSLLKEIIPSLQAVIFRLVRQEDAVREILQEAFIRIWMHRDKLPDLEKPEAWLKRVTLNETFTWLNKNAYRARIFSGLSADAGVSESTGIDNLSLYETQKILQQAIDQLPPQRRRIYLMSRSEGLRAEEIARQLNLSSGYVKNALTAALDFLRQRLKDAGKMMLFLFI